MALTVAQLIEKLEKVPNKDIPVCFETPNEMTGVTGAYIDDKEYLTMYNAERSDRCECNYCMQNQEEL